MSQEKTERERISVSRCTPVALIFEKRDGVPPGGCRQFGWLACANRSQPRTDGTSGIQQYDRACGLTTAPRRR